MNSRLTTLFASIALLLIGAVLGVFIAPYIPFSPSAANAAAAYQTGFTAARTLVENSSVGSFFKTSNDIRFVSGTVTALKGNTLTLHSQSVNNPFDLQALNDRTVTIASSTKIVLLTPRDPKTVQAELVKVMSTLRATSTAKSNATPVVLPQSYDQKVVTVSSIKVGDQITVVASQNIKTTAAFTAKEIQIQR